MRKHRMLSLMLAALLLFGCIGFASAETPQVMANATELSKYGNVYLSISTELFLSYGYAYGDVVKVSFGETTLELPLVSNYSDVDLKSPALVAMSGANLQLAINMANFATTYGLAVGDVVAIELSVAGGYYDAYIQHQLTRTNNREDYPALTDAEFANFRAVKAGTVIPGALYRSSSPVNNAIGRAAYADDAAELAKISTVINLADDTAAIDGYIAAEGFDSPYYQTLYAAGQVVALNMAVDFSDTAFRTKLAEGLRFMIANPGPYLIHCNEGKDRAGFVAAILECLAGATLDEVVDDYMVSYYNYYGVTAADTEKYQAIANSNIKKTLESAFAVADVGAADVDLQALAVSYVSGLGLSEAEIRQLLACYTVSGSSVGELTTAGTVTSIEKYGHAVLDVLISDMNTDYAFSDTLDVRIYGATDGELKYAADNVPYLDGYFVDKGEPLVRAYPTHTNIAVAINYTSLGATYGVAAGDHVVLTLNTKLGYQTEYEIRNLTRTNVRSDYASLSDAEFANFRMIKVGKVADGILYRSSNPLNNELGRAAYADDACEAAGIKVGIDLADSAEDVAGYVAAEGFDSPYYKGLYDAGKVVLLNMGIDYTADAFKAGVKTAAEFMLTNKGPYVVHCNEGKDRAGFVSALLGALCEGSEDELYADYMRSYSNYYGLVAGTEKYAIVGTQFAPMLAAIKGDKDTLAEGARAYLTACGLSDAQIDALYVALTTPLADATRLNAAVTYAEAVLNGSDSSKFSAKLRAKWEAALADAKKLLANENATQAQFDDAATRIYGLSKTGESTVAFVFVGVALTALVGLALVQRRRALLEKR